MNLSRHQPSSRGTVVIVDDDPAVCNSLKFSLEIEGFAVRLYESGTELLNKLPTCSCLVVDENMPGITGLDLIAMLRDRNITAAAILITWHPNTALARRAARINVPIVEKPLLNDALLDLVRRACATGSPA
jgi:two-component system, LuxR family, response regulator FixJ